MIADVRTDVRGLRADMNAFRAETREEFKAFRVETQGEFKAVRAEMRDEFTAVRGELRQEFTAVRGELREFRVDMLRRFEQVDTRFNWVLGLLFAIVLAFVSALLRLG